MNKLSKNIVTLIVGVVLLFVPTYIAIINYFSAQYAPVSRSNVTKLEITDMKGNIFTLSPDVRADEADIDSFISINDGAIEQPSLPDQLKESDYFEFKY